MDKEAEMEVDASLSKQGQIIGLESSDTNQPPMNQHRAAKHIPSNWDEDTDEDKSVGGSEEQSRELQ